MEGKAWKVYIAIHGHFYQPPRENPWIEEIEFQSSAAPYHDWNERVSAEAYEPNASAKLFDPQGRITKVVNNYEKISFNFGPTLLDWLKVHRPWLVKKLVEADKKGELLFGVGNAIAQGYNHIILPLAKDIDLETQIIWGIKHFESVFNRKPLGMWLPETAVDMRTLRYLAKHGIRFTILAPSQIEAVRPIGSDTWIDVRGERVDPSRPYLVDLGNGDSIVIFVFDGPISRAIAFEDVLSTGDKLYNRLKMGIDPSRRHHQIILAAADGETFGHHKKFGDLALAYALKLIEEDPNVELITPGAYLSRHSVEWEAKIIENTSWSCPHGLKRWYDNCGCNTMPGWHQLWRRPLRDGLNWLKDRLDEIFESYGSRLLKEPWEARNDYIDVILDRSVDNVEEFFLKHAKRALSPSEKVLTLKLLEMQRHGMLMFTSCGWFFNDISGIETVQILQYAARAIQLAKEIAKVDLENHLLLEYLQHAPSNLPEFKNGMVVWEKLVKPKIFTFPKALAEHVIGSIFDQNKDGFRNFRIFHFEHKDRKLLKRPPFLLSIGAVSITSKVTWESADLTYSVIYLGGYELRASIGNYLDMITYEEMRDDLIRTFKEDSILELIRKIDDYFPGVAFTLNDLSTDQKVRAVSKILSEEIGKLSSLYHSIYRGALTKISYLKTLGVPIPVHFLWPAKFSLIDSIMKILASLKKERDLSKIHNLIKDLTNVLEQCAYLDMRDLKVIIRGHIEAVIQNWINKIKEKVRGDLSEEELGALNSYLEFSLTLLEIAQRFRIELDLSKVQNTYWELITSTDSRKLSIKLLRKLGEALFFSFKTLEMLVK